MKLDRDNVRVGRTRILYRALEYRTLELQWPAEIFCGTTCFLQIGTRCIAHS